MYAAGPGRLRISPQPQPFQLLPRGQGRLAHGPKRGPLRRVEIQDGVVEVFQRPHARGPDVLRDRGELDGIEQRVEIATNDTFHLLAFDFQRHRPDTLRHRPCRFLLVEHLTGDPVGVTLQRERAIGDHGKDRRRHRQVVAEQLPLGHPVVGPEDLRRVGDLEAPALHQQVAVHAILFQTFEDLDKRLYLGGELHGRTFDGRGDSTLAGHTGRVDVRAQAQEDRLTQPTVPSPFLEFHLGD